MSPVTWSLSKSPPAEKSLDQPSQTGQCKQISCFLFLWLLGFWPVTHDKSYHGSGNNLSDLQLASLWIRMVLDINGLFTSRVIGPEWLTQVDIYRSTDRILLDFHFCPVCVDLPDAFTSRTSQTFLVYPIMNLFHICPRQNNGYFSRNFCPCWTIYRTQQASHCSGKHLHHISDCQSLLFSGECILGALTTCAYLPEWAQSRPCEANIPGLTAVCLPSDETEWLSIGWCRTLLISMKFWLVAGLMFKGLNCYFYVKVKAVDYFCGWQVLVVLMMELCVVGSVAVNGQIAEHLVVYLWLIGYLLSRLRCWVYRLFTLQGIWISARLWMLTLEDRNDLVLVSAVALAPFCNRQDTKLPRTQF